MVICYGSSRKLIHLPTEVTDSDTQMDPDGPFQKFPGLVFIEVEYLKVFSSLYLTAEFEAWVVLPQRYQILRKYISL